MNTGRRSRPWVPLVWAALVLAIGTGIYLVRLNPVLWTQLGERHLRVGRLVAAERAFQRALDIDPDHAPALYGVGWAYLRADLVAPAEERFQLAVLVEPGFHGGHRGLAEILRREGDIRGAEARLRTAYELAPNEPSILADLAGIYLDADHPAEAMDLFQRAVEAAPRRAEYRLAGAEALLALGRTDEARVWIGEARERTSRNQRFAAAADELALRAALLEIRQIDALGGLDADGCQHARRLIGQAQAHLEAALALGLQRELASADRGDLESVRVLVEEACGAH